MPTVSTRETEVGETTLAIGTQTRYRHPPLLVADSSKTFIWDEPLIYFAATRILKRHESVVRASEILEYLARVTGS
jgi:hypothetical protein